MTCRQKEFFDEMALRYQRQAILVPGASRFRNILLDKAMKRALTPILKGFSNMLILDVGCGVGRWTEKMSAKNTVIGMDISKFMVSMAKNTCKNRKCDFLVADASYIPFREGVFDLVISVTVLQHILDERKFRHALSEMARCTNLKALILEEMWSDKVTLIEKAYCPICIVPVESYMRILSAAGLHIRWVGGVTFAPLAVVIARILGSKPRLMERVSTTNLKTSKTISGLVHFVMGIGILTAVFIPNGFYGSRVSLHTMICGERSHHDDS